MKIGNARTWTKDFKKLIENKKYKYIVDYLKSKDNKLDEYGVIVVLNGKGFIEEGIYDGQEIIFNILFYNMEYDSKIWYIVYRSKSEMRRNLAFDLIDLIKDHSLDPEDINRLKDSKIVNKYQIGTLLSMAEKTKPLDVFIIKKFIKSINKNIIFMVYNESRLNKIELGRYDVGYMSYNKLKDDIIENLMINMEKSKLYHISLSINFELPEYILNDLKTIFKKVKTFKPNEWTPKESVIFNLKINKIRG